MKRTHIEIAVKEGERKKTETKKEVKAKVKEEAKKAPKAEKREAKPEERKAEKKEEPKAAKVPTAHELAAKKKEAGQSTENKKPEEKKE